MANALYANGKRALMQGAIDLDNDTIRCVLVDAADYTPDLANDTSLADIPVGGRVATQPLVSKTTNVPTPGVFDADDVVFSAVAGDQFEYLVIYRDSGLESTSQLIALFDTASGIPFTPSGSDILVVWDSGANRIFAL